eukprot:TRINITY_DN10191_c0_g1_i5.p1 TRINITY_DN10191_c0_g1~~TRINITY_DN10191_c0_g1_i5.p1  ORF type:complete len:104 (-),score=11.48 TRINITY_DN10191_c0_g1_i5:170-481(-)
MRRFSFPLPAIGGRFFTRVSDTFKNCLCTEVSHLDAWISSVHEHVLYEDSSKTMDISIPFNGTSEFYGTNKRKNTLEFNCTFMVSKVGVYASKLGLISKSTNN